MKRIEASFVVFAFLFYTGAITILINGGTFLGGTTKDPISKVSIYLIQLVTLFLVIAHHKKIIPIVAKEKLLWILIVIALLSVLWSKQLIATLADCQNLVRVTLFGVYLATRFSMKEQLQLLAWALGIGALLSLVFALVVPSYGVMGMGSIVTLEDISHAGAWRGVYGHKNVLGRLMVLGAVVLLVAANFSGRYRWVAWAGFLITIILIVKSTSKTALITVMTILILLPIYRFLRWNYTIVIPLLITAVLVGGGVIVFLVNNAESILLSFGRDPTFTGRTPLWEAVFDKIWEHPWLGYGLGGFWRGMEGESADISILLNWEVPHSHNGFLDLWLDLGLIGLLAFVFSFLSVLIRAISWIHETKTAEGLWPLAYLTFLLMANLTESSIMRQSIIIIIYVVVTLSMYPNRNEPDESQTLVCQKSRRGAIKQAKTRKKTQAKIKGKIK